MKKAVALFASASLALCALANFKLENDKVLFELDDNANLVHLKNKPGNRDYAGGQGLWRIIYNEGQSLEECVEAESVPKKIEKLSDSKLKISYAGRFPVEVVCELSDDEIILTPKIFNKSKDSVLREFQFPIVKNLSYTPDDKLIVMRAGGQQFRNILAHMKGAFTAYMAEDQNQIERANLYPGDASSNFYLVEDGKSALYIANYDSTFDKNLHLFRLRDFLKNPQIDLAMVKYPYLAPGGEKTYDPYILSPHVGDWRVSARKYSKWAHTWYKQCNVADSVKVSNGWHRVILRHQYGKIFYKYDDLWKIRKSGAECGIGTLFMFGWAKEGHDAGYPEYNPDLSQGGDENLKRNIEKFQSDGGTVIVYYNGQLIDMDTDFYRTLGKKVSVKTMSGADHTEFYKFGGMGTSLRRFGHKSFVTACPSCPEWREHLKKLVDRAIALGAKGVFFDQLGLPSHTCWDKSHGHSVPCMDVMGYKRDLVRELRKYVDSKKPGMSLGIEWQSDCTSEFCDYIHNCGFDTGIAGKEKNGKPYVRSIPISKYIFPELKISDRCIRDDRDVERRVNLALMWGWFTDIEIYRCRAIIDETPHYKAYLKLANGLRDKYRALICNGTFRDRDLAEISEEKVDYTTFENDKQIAVLATNTWLKNAECSVKVPNAKFVKADGIGEFSAKEENGSVKLSVAKNALALLLYEKNK